jgi:hypothetical protein
MINTNTTALDEVTQAARSANTVLNAREEQPATTVPGIAPTAIEPSAAHIVAVGNALLAQMRADGEEIASTPRGLWWRDGAGEWVRTYKKLLAVRIEIVCCQIGIASSTGLIYETRKWLERQPGIWRNDLPQWERWS